MVKARFFVCALVHATLSMVYKGHVKNETSPSLSKIWSRHCCIYDVIASLLLNKAPKKMTSVPYKGFPYKLYCVYCLYIDGACLSVCGSVFSNWHEVRRHFRPDFDDHGADLLADVVVVLEHLTHHHLPLGRVQRHLRTRHVDGLSTKQPDKRQ